MAAVLPRRRARLVRRLRPPRDIRSVSMTDDSSGSDLLRGAAGLAQVAASSSWRIARWTANASLAGTGYVVQRAVAGEPATAIMQEAAQDLRAAAWRALGIVGAAP